MINNEHNGVFERAEAICLERGVRLTKQRKTVLQQLCSSNKPLSAYELLERMRSDFKNPSPPTVYRALDFLMEQGLAHKIESLNAYVGCAHPGHTHTTQFLICVSCGEVVEVENHCINDSLNEASQAVGFCTKKPVIELLGTCEKCSENKKCDT